MWWYQRLSCVEIVIGPVRYSLTGCCCFVWLNSQRFSFSHDCSRADHSSVAAFSIPSKLDSQNNSLVRAFSVLGKRLAVWIILQAKHRVMTIYTNI
jgi:hypothetical protein